MVYCLWFEINACTIREITILNLMWTLALPVLQGWYFLALESVSITIFDRNVVGLALGYSKAIIVDLGFCLQVSYRAKNSGTSITNLFFCRVMRKMSYPKC